MTAGAPSIPVPYGRPVSPVPGDLPPPSLAWAPSGGPGTAAPGDAPEGVVALAAEVDPRAIASGVPFAGATLSPAGDIVTAAPIIETDRPTTDVRTFGIGDQVTASVAPVAPFEAAPVAIEPIVLPDIDALTAALPAATLDRARVDAIAARHRRALDGNGFDVALLGPALPVTTQARMRYQHGGEAPLTDLVIGAMLLATGSCGANVEPSTQVASAEGGWLARFF